MKKSVLIIIAFWGISMLSYSQNMNKPELIKADNKAIDIRLGYVGQTLFDMDHDGLKDIIAGDVFGQIYFFKNIKNKKAPAFDKPEIISIEGENKIIYNW